MDVKQQIFNAIHPSITKEGIEKMFRIIVNTNPIDRVIEMITSDDEVVIVDSDIFLKLIQKKYNTKDITVTDYRKEGDIEVNYITGLITSCFNEIRYHYCSTEDSEDYRYCEDDNHKVRRPKDDYNYRDCTFKEYKKFVEELSRPVEE